MLIDLRNRANEPVVQELLSYAIGMPVPEKLKQIAKSYREDVNLALWGVEDDGSLIGCLGVRCSPHGDVVILHLSVHPAHRRRYVASRMIESLLQSGAVQTVSAETDQDAVDFYARCGFAIRSLGEKYPGVERFACVYPPS